MNAATALMFLDIDDVLCLSSPYGGYAALEAVDGQHADPAAVYRDLFVPRARDALRRVHDEMGGALNYVISSTWREIFERAQLETVFRRSGLDFVADRLCEGARWCTPPTRHANQRVHQIAQWLDRHHRGESFVIVDDTFSGPSLLAAFAPAPHPFAGRVVLCEENVGLRDDHVRTIVDALRRPLDPAGAHAP